MNTILIGLLVAIGITVILVSVEFYFISLPIIFGILFYKSFSKSIKIFLKNQKMQITKKVPLDTVILNPNESQRIRNFRADYNYHKDNNCNEFLNKYRAILVDISKRKNALFELRDVLPDRILKILRYTDPSTSKTYLSFTPDYIQKADDAMAWKFRLTEKEYDYLRDEA
jgi:hypothetical protein